MWTIAVSAKKKLRIQKYPDTCGRGLRLDKRDIAGPIIRGVAFVLTFIYWHNFENLKLSVTDKLYETERERIRDVMMSEHLQAGVKGRSKSHRIS